ncbi:MAG: Maltodextrin phosphorylase [Pelotomaculum sp. PtaB.Bin013]|nr:MAG: Maltodextrin phosphorylase [Pelotomaculum sp. PtaB.Bin013]
MRIKIRMLEHLKLPVHLSGFLVVGFARRFAAYKRATLLIHDLERLDRIVNHPERPVCIIFAGKAHPADGLGQELLRRIVEVARMDRFRERIFFIENYDIENAKQLVQGVDVWLNTPVKPMEASGTSGQKAAVNGVINCSILDGWWDEGYNGANGWAIPSVADADQAERDRVERESLYNLLENEIAPQYYRRNQESLPREWILMMKESICSLTPVFCTDRMVMEYQNKLYCPAADRGLKFTANNFEVARRVADYKQFIRNNWHYVQVETVELTDSLIQSQIRLGPIWHGDVMVEFIYTDALGEIWREKLELKGLLSPGVHIYMGRFRFGSGSSLKSEANIRVVPVSPDFANDFELELTTWGRR